MSTKSTIIETNDGEHIYFDCVNQFFTENGNIGSELTFEFEAKNADLLIDENSDYFTVNLTKDSELYRFFCRHFRDFNVNIESVFSKILSFYVLDGNPEVFKQKIEQYKSELLSM